jgi:uncharacterized protein YhaN
MRIDRLDLIAYGPFTDHSLDLSAGNAGLHLIYGDNEAGKSTSLRALTAWLFGIPARCNDNFLHPHPQLRIGGQLRLTDGRQLTFVRRKGTKGTLLDPADEAPLDDAVLQPFLPAGLDEPLFTQLYGIDHSRLIEGGQALLNQSGDLGQALFSAAVGAAGPREILSELKEAAEALYKPRASTKLVNQALSAYRDAQKRVKEAALPVAEWKRLQKTLTETLSELQQVETEIQEQSRAKSRLERLKRVGGALAERRETIARIEAMASVRLLPDDFDDKRKAATDTLRNATESKAKAEAKLARLIREAETLDVRNALLENEEAILTLYRELGAVEKTVQDRPQQDGKRRQLRNEAELLLKAVRPDVELNAADQLRPLLNLKQRLGSLARQHGLLQQQQKTAENDRRDLETELKAIRSELGEAPSIETDPTALKAAIAEARQAGRIEQQLADTRKRARTQRVACETELARLGRFAGSLEALAAIPLPLPATLDTAEKMADDLDDQTKHSVRQQKELEAEIKQAELDLKALLMTRDVPTVAALEQARRLRDSGWRLIKRRYIEKEDVSREVAAFADDGDLTAVYERSTVDADLLADRLYSEAELVARRADLETRIESLNTRLTAHTDALRRLDTDKTLQQNRWIAIWEPLRITPGSPREMKQWLLRVDKLLADFQTAESTAADVRKLETDTDTIRNRITHHVARFDPAIDPATTGLENLLLRCEQYIAQEDAKRDTRRQLERTLQQIETRLAKITQSLILNQQSKTDWDQQWQQTITALGLPPDTHPDAAIAAFERLVEFFEKFDKAEDLRRRIYGMDLVSEKFQQKVFDFTAQIKLDSGGQTAATIAARLNRDLTAAREARVSLEKNLAQQKEVGAEIAETDITIEKTQEQLAELRTLAQVDDDGQLAAAAESSQQLRALNAGRTALEQELARNGDGLSLQALEAEAGAADIDACDGEMEQVLLTLQTLQQQRDNLRDRRQSLQDDIDAKDGGAAAAAASEEAAQQLATISAGTEQYLRLQIAALILEQQIETYRRQNQAPVLSRAADLFSKLTLGSYRSLRDELISGIPILLGVRHNRTEVRVDGMSDGTRDQLFLSLRLATLEQHLSRGEPIPLVVDDILISFDDRRTRVCLEILAELAARTQVLLFTHHRRVLELAADLTAPAGIFPHELT